MTVRTPSARHLTIAGSELAPLSAILMKPRKARACFVFAHGAGAGMSHPFMEQVAAGLYPWLQIECSRCRTPNEVDLAALNHPPTTCVHDLASRLRCQKCTKAGRRPRATLLQLAPRPRHGNPKDQE